VGGASSPPATLTFHAALLMPDGSPMLLLPDEELLGSFADSALAACTSWSPAESVIEMQVPVTQVVGQVLASGVGIQMRAEVDAGADEWDLLNDSFTRMVLPEEIPVLADS